MQGHQFRCLLCANNSNLAHLLSCTVSEIWQIIGLIVGVYRGASFNALVAGETLNSGCKICPQEARSYTLSYTDVKHMFRYPEPFRHDGGIVRQTDILRENAALSIY